MASLLFNGTLHSHLDLASKNGNHVGNRKNEFRLFSWVLSLLELMRKGIRFHITGSRIVGEGEIEMGKEQGAECFTLIQYFGSSDEL